MLCCEFSKIFKHTHFNTPFLTHNNNAQSRNNQRRRRTRTTTRNPEESPYIALRLHTFQESRIAQCKSHKIRTPWIIPQLHNHTLVYERLRYGMSLRERILYINKYMLRVLHHTRTRLWVWILYRRDEREGERQATKKRNKTRRTVLPTCQHP